ncbi:hypothetical protein RvY_05227 [Ramazzottius varieornatus]|uniref:Uncharacterized protein n=1 Tax=Ramazzottius varieornatus TaxID=947166 RepID=A0A1D1UUY4_RAMVA|nr:hypothetical protein RvY_05227 [Ramazzottius varieornatus]
MAFRHGNGVDRDDRVTVMPSVTMRKMDHACRIQGLTLLIRNSFRERSNLCQSS